MASGVSRSARLGLQCGESCEGCGYVVVAPRAVSHGVQGALDGGMVEGPAGCRAVGEEEVARESLYVIEVMYLVMLLEFLDDALESLMDDVQVLQVAHLCLEREVVLVSSGPLESLWHGVGQWGEGGLPIGGGCRGGGVVQQQGDA